jgi:hypothetical protein
MFFTVITLIAQETEEHDDDHRDTRISMEEEVDEHGTSANGVPGRTNRSKASSKSTSWEDIGI